MSTVAAGEPARVAYPSAGTVRVHPDPTWLAPPDPDLPGENRFDDPSGLVSVRYSATRLTGALYELLSRFRREPQVSEPRLAAMVGVDPGDVEWDDETEVPPEWLAAQNIGTVRVLDPGEFVDIEAPAMLVQLDKHPEVRRALQALDPSARLDMGYTRLGGQLGRPVTQAVGVAVREWVPQALGIAYTSRLAAEPCWAIWHWTRVEVKVEPLRADDPVHRASLDEVAAAFELTLPETWEREAPAPEVTPPSAPPRPRWFRSRRPR